MTADEANSLPDPPIVDAHAHIFERGLPLSADAWMAPDYDFTAQDYLAQLDSHGIHFGVLSALSISGFYNDYTIAAAARCGRLRATAIVPPESDLYTLAQMRDDGVVGIRLQLARARVLPDLREEAYQRLLRRVRDLDWHVHVAIEGPRLPPILAALEEAGVKIVIDHFGHPEPSDGMNCKGFEAMLASVDRGRTWIKLSGGFRLLGTDSWRDPSLDAWQFAREMATGLLAKVGTERLLWGSDCPFVGYEGRVSYAEVLGQFESWAPDIRTRRAISDTALKFYFA